MFQFAGLPPRGPWIRPRGAGPSSGGFAHSGTRGSKAVCAYPRTIAACRALLRLPEPRHPPRALHILRPLPGGAPPSMPISHDSNLSDRRTLTPPGALPPAAIGDASLTRRYFSSISQIGSFIFLESIGQRHRAALLAMRLSRYAGSDPGTGRCGGCRGASGRTRTGPRRQSVSFSSYGSLSP